MSKDDVQYSYASLVKQLTQSEKAWEDFLTYASRIYKYPFETAIFAYAQNKNATMIATYDIWKKVGRQVKRGEKSITVSTEYDGYPKKVHYFDITQTEGNTMPYLWKLDDELKKELLNRLSGNIKYNSLYDFIDKSVSKVLDSSYEKFSKQLKLITDNVPELKELSGTEINCFITQSTRYITSKRCDSNYSYNNEPFANIINYNNVDFILKTGTYISKLSQSILSVIEKQVKLIIKERSVDNERRTINQSSLHREGRNQVVTVPDGGGHRPRTLGQSLTPLSSGGGRRQSSNTESPWQTDIHLQESSERSRGQNRPDNRTDDREISGSDRLVGKSPTSEVDTDNSTGNSNKRDSQSVPLKENNQKQEPSNDGSFLLPETLTKAEQLSEIKKVLYSYGSGFEDGKQRIYDFFNNNEDSTARAKFLKKEFGIGGASNSTYSIDHIGKDLTIEVKASGIKETLTWAKTSEIIAEMIENGRYLEIQIAKPIVEQIAFEDNSNSKEVETIVAPITVSKTKNTQKPPLDSENEPQIEQISFENVINSPKPTVINQDNIKESVTAVVNDDEYISNEKSNSTKSELLITSIKNGDYEKVQSLIDEGVDISESVNGKTPLHVAVEFESGPITGLLISHNADVDKTDDKQNTPLYYAVKSNNIDTASRLLMHGADSEKQTACGLSIKDFAKSDEMKEVIERYGKNENQSNSVSLHI